MAKTSKQDLEAELHSILEKFKATPIPVKLREELAHRQNSDFLSLGVKHPLVEALQARLSLGYFTGLSETFPKQQPSASEVQKEDMEYDLPMHITSTILLDPVPEGQKFECRIQRITSTLRASTVYRLSLIRVTTRTHQPLPLPFAGVSPTDQQSHSSPATAQEVFLLAARKSTSALSSSTCYIYAEEKERQWQEKLCFGWLRTCPSVIHGDVSIAFTNKSNQVFSEQQSSKAGNGAACSTDSIAVQIWQGSSDTKLLEVMGIFPDSTIGSDQQRGASPLKKQHFMEKELLREFEAAMRAPRVKHRTPKLKRPSSRSTMASVQPASSFSYPSAQSAAGDPRASDFQTPAVDASHNGTVLFSNKPALWDQTLGCHTLQFEWPSAIRDTSRKNLALVMESDICSTAETLGGCFGPDETARLSPSNFQLGKLSDDTFGLIFTQPFSPFQAFAAALSIFDS